MKALETLEKTNGLLNQTEIRYNAVKRRAEETRANLASDVRKAEHNLSDVQEKVKKATEIEPKLIQETTFMKSKIETIKNRIQVLAQISREHQQSFDDLKQKLNKLTEECASKQTVAENLFSWIHKNEENLTSQFHGRLKKEYTEMNRLLQEKSEICYKFKMNETELKSENDRREERILCYQNEITKLRRSVELLESRLTTAQDLLHSSNADYNRTNAKHSSVANDLEITKSRTWAEQDDIQNMLKYLQRKMKRLGESALKVRMMVELESNLQEFEKTKQESYRKRLELETTAKQLESTTENANTELEAVQHNHKYYLEQLHNAENEYRKFEDEWNQEYSTIRDKIKTLSDSLTQSKAQANKLEITLEEVNTEKAFLQDRGSKLKLSLLALMKVKLRTTTKIGQLRCTIAELVKQIKY
ncbi:unnamed protein product [Heterobilharzia americana]|nr:unnamed protein product [Heterobilharzia americana]